MTTEKLYYVDSYLKQADARVLSCKSAKKGWAVCLDQTIFYPTGGGQPCDVGFIDETRVLEVSEEDGEIVHFCDAALPVGKLVSCSIDWRRRFDLMQQHSGEHLISGMVHARFGYENVGFHMGSDVITIDFDGELTCEALAEIEQAVNEAVWQNIKTKIWYPDAEELCRLPYRSKKALSGAIRLVEFGRTDLCACCGTHVARTGEIGMIKLLSTTRFRDGSRVEFVCGGRALRWVNAICGQNREISNLLSAKPVETAKAVRRVAVELNTAQYRLTQIENQLFALRAQQLQGDVLLFEETMSGDSLRRMADAVTQRCGGRCAIFAGEDGAYKYAVGKQNGDLRRLVQELNAQLHGRGGGKSDFVQGFVAATRAEIESFFGHFSENEN